VKVASTSSLCIAEAWEGERRSSGKGYVHISRTDTLDNRQDSSTKLCILQSNLIDLKDNIHKRDIIIIINLIDRQFDRDYIPNYSQSLLALPQPLWSLMHSRVPKLRLRGRRVLLKPSTVIRFRHVDLISWLQPTPCTQSLSAGFIRKSSIPPNTPEVGRGYSRLVGDLSQHVSMVIKRGIREA
jgi:hypothetical protein